ncbi:MAG: rod shape-determining protein MreD [Chloroflexi bacterium]|nr:rod shape-determining protein MreD [Chloroflexota bacterium]
MALRSLLTFCHIVRFLTAFAFLTIAVALQSVLALRLPVGSVRPDLPLVIVLAWAMLRGSNEAAAVGFLAGVLLDSASATPFGVNAALLGIAGFLTGLGETNLYRGNVAFFLGTGAVATAAYHLLEYLLLQAMGVGLPSFLSAVLASVPAAVLNALLLVPAFLLVRHTLRALTGWRELRI